MNRPTSSLEVVGQPKANPFMQAAPFSDVVKDEMSSIVMSMSKHDPLTLVVLKSQDERSDVWLCDMLIQCDETVHLQQCNDLQEAIGVVSANPASILFVDIEWATRLPAHLSRLVPTVVSGKSCEHALEAFSANAKGFLLKPYNHAQVTECVSHLISDIRNNAERLRIERVCEKLSEQQGLPVQALVATLRRRCHSISNAVEHVTIRCGNSWLCLHPKSIKWIEAAGDYMCVYVDGDTHIVRSTLIELMKRLPQEQFVRVNRSLVVNLERVKRLLQLGGMTFFVELDDKTQHKISRRYYTAYWSQFEVEKSHYR